MQKFFIGIELNYINHENNTEQYKHGMNSELTDVKSELSSSRATSLALFCGIKS